MGIPRQALKQLELLQGWRCQRLNAETSTCKAVILQCSPQDKSMHSKWREVEMGLSLLASPQSPHLEQNLCSWQALYVIYTLKNAHCTDIADIHTCVEYVQNA